MYQKLAALLAILAFGLAACAQPEEEVMEEEPMEVMEEEPMGKM
ncbi:MAG: hypothetical protein OXI81_08240 [Paracoccaceae bacterium]|nr:hypothetical protein [Paracoccaceae bacterium]MDE2913862.1 hypothetical protein [Paracoccaceae bacterium]